MATLRKPATPKAKPGVKKSPPAKLSAYAKSPIGKLVAAMRDIPVDKIPAWPINQ